MIDLARSGGPSPRRAEDPAGGRPVPRLALAGITKRYPGVVANDSVDLDILPGEIHALLGENGAGKSTLVKIIYGVTAPDEGRILWQGEPVVIPTPAAARRLGIGMVFQHFTLFETLTVAENVALGMEGKPDLRALAREIADTGERYGLHLDPRRHVHALSVGERQRVEIVRALLQHPRLLVMDEPTSVLAPQEVDRLFVVLRRLAEEGMSVLFISHKLDEVRSLCGAATVLRRGRMVGRCDPRQTDTRSLAGMMVGGEIPEPHGADRPAAGAPCLTVRNLSLPSDDPHGTALDDVSFDLRAGEILGVAGVAGNGQHELLAALSGERPAPRADSVQIDGRPVGRLGTAARRRRGLAFVPEERLGRGAVAEMDLGENGLLTAYGAGLVTGGLTRPRRMRAFAARVIERFDVVARGPGAEARSLSGGNLQKFIIGREMAVAPKVLVAAHPTWGVDIGAAAVIHQALFDLCAAGAGVLVVSEDLDELFRIADRIAVIAHGRVSAPVERDAADREEIGLLMTAGQAGERSDAA